MKLLWKTIQQFLKSLKIYLSHDNSSTPGYLCKKNENIHLHRNLYTNVHGNIFDIAKREKQIKCLSTDKCINKMLHIHSIKYCVAMKRNDT